MTVVLEGDLATPSCGADQDTRARIPLDAALWKLPRCCCLPLAPGVVKHARNGLPFFARSSKLTPLYPDLLPGARSNVSPSRFANSRACSDVGGASATKEFSYAACALRASSRPMCRAYASDAASGLLNEPRVLRRLSTCTSTGGKKPSALIRSRTFASAAALTATLAKVFVMQHTFSAVAVRTAAWLVGAVSLAEVHAAEASRVRGGHQRKPFGTRNLQGLVPAHALGVL
eukprot:4548325-Prymnesium_polylepis.2